MFIAMALVDVSALERFVSRSISLLWSFKTLGSGQFL